MRKQRLRESEALARLTAEKPACLILDAPSTTSVSPFSPFTLSNLPSVHLRNGVVPVGLMPIQLWGVGHVI